MAAPTARASGTDDGTKPISPFSSLTSSSIVFSPSSTSSRYSSSFPSSDASAIVTWMPRTSSGSARGVRAAAALLGAGLAGAAFGVEAVVSSSPITNFAPAASVAVEPRSTPIRTARRRWRFRRASSRRARKRSFGSRGSNSIDTGRERYVENLSSATGAVQSAAVVLSDRTIRELLDEGRIQIDPYDEALLQPSSVDVRVDRYFRVFRNSRYPFIDVKTEQEELTELVEIDGETPFILHPGEFVLGSTLERVRLPDDLVARLEGKSSLGRLGLLIHSTAGFIDPGWDGHVTLELSNVANLPITIYHGMKIGQLSFVRLSTAAEKPYGSGGLGSKYQGQQGPTPSRYWKNFES